MPRDYIKQPDHELEVQVAQFLANIGAVKTALGLLQMRKSDFTP